MSYLKFKLVKRYNFYIYVIRKKFSHIMYLRVYFTLKRQSHEIFLVSFFFPNSSSWSHLECPRAVLIFFASWLSYKHFKMTPQCPMHRGVKTPWCPRYRRVETPRCPMYRGVIICFFEPSSPCYWL